MPAAPRKADRLPPAVLTHHRRFLAFLKNRVGDEQTAEDILQAAYARGLGKLSTLKDEEKVIAWFYRLLRNATVDHHRRRSAEKRAFDALERDAEGRREAVDRDLERTVCRCVSALVGTLKPEYADVLKKAEIEDRSIKDIAAAARTTPTNISVRLHRARRQLKEKVLQTCGACASHGCTDCSCRHPV